MNASNDATKLSANAALNDSQFFIRIPRLARLIHGSCEQLCAVVREGAPSVHPGAAAPAAAPPDYRRVPAFDAKTLSFFSTSRACSIDFSRFAPMFRFDAARYRNAIS
jgi:hypothetical protein